MDTSLDTYVGRPHETEADVIIDDPASAGAAVSRLDDAFFVELWNLAHAVQLPPEWFLEIFYLESGLNPNVAANPRYPNYAGLNQIGRAYLPRGIALEDYRTWSASEQMRRVVSDFMKRQIADYGKAPRSAGVLYGLNFLPGIVKAKGDAPEAVLASASNDPNQYYAANRGLDFDKDGKITIKDLDAVVASKWKAPVVQAAAQRLYAIAATPSKSGGPSATILAVFGLLLGAGGVLAYKRLQRGHVR